LPLLASRRPSVIKRIERRKTDDAGDGCDGVRVAGGRHAAPEYGDDDGV